MRVSPTARNPPLGGACSPERVPSPVHWCCVGGAKGPPIPTLPSFSGATPDDDDDGTFSKEFEEHTAIRSSEDLDEILRQAQEKSAPSRNEFADEEHTAISSSQELAAKSMKVPDEVAPAPVIKSSANVVRRTNPAMPAVRLSETMPAVRASGSMPAMTAADVRASSPSLDGARASSPPPTDDELLDAAFADPPAAVAAQEVAPAPAMVNPAAMFARAPTPTPPPMPHAAPLPLSAPRAQSAPMAPFDLGAPPVAEDSGKRERAHWRLFAIAWILLLGIGAASGFFAYNRVSQAQRRAASAEAEAIAAEAAALDVNRRLKAKTAEVEALEAANAKLTKQIAEQQRLEQERLKPPKRK